MTEGRDRLREVMEQVTSKVSQAAFIVGDRSLRHAKATSTGVLPIDVALGIGGYPQGRIVEIYGPESSGKTTLALHAVAAAQSVGGAAVFIDAEHALDPLYAEALGVDLSALGVVQPDCGEDALEAVVDFCRAGIDLVIIDSVAALSPRAEIDGDMGAPHMGLQARLMSQAMRKLTSVAHKANATVIFINQIRMKIGVIFGSPETTPGGNALKFYSSVRLDIRRRALLKHKDGTPYGNRTKVKVVKNKCAPPFAEVEFDILWGRGVEPVRALLETAINLGIVTKKGAWLYHGEDKLAHGQANAIGALESDDDLKGAIEASVKDEL